ncbi:hypothetical protein E3J59_00420 [Candidatus Aerophobetes bacterium]|uniref:Uncharacterized protein n=1 Tax=Aerophobetes bacterium TaxID=2030807 RepID=A0A523V1F8_UNCAE|nr:MAG: hypothetical protein E3J59_00420 [Candidatus Aerophobetes bacterium]
MKIRYGKGVYRRLEGGKETTYTGEVVLNDVKIYIDGEPDSFIALDRIEEIEKAKKSLGMKIVPSYPFTYEVRLQGEGMERLLDDLLILKPFGKLWWKNKWKAG